MAEIAPSFEDLGQRLDALGETLRATPELHQPIEVSREQVRAHITKVVIWGFLIALAAIILWVISCGIWVTDQARCVSTTGTLVELVKTAMIPIVTFVIGHYFGSSS